MTRKVPVFLNVLDALLIGFLTSSALFAKELPLPLYEIRRSMEKDFGVSFNEPEPKPSEKQEAKEEAKIVPPPPKKTLSPGEIKMQEALRKNREILKARYAKEKLRQKKKNSSASWMERKKGEMEDWKDSRLESIKRWKEAKEKFLKELPELKKDLTNLGDLVQKDRTRFGSVKVGFKESELKKSSRVEDRAEGLSLVKGSFELPVRIQGRRPTCAAFAGVRALEIMAPKKVNLSEQALYYQSKSQCQKSPCSKAGSWPYAAFYQSQNSLDFDIPLEEDCPYNLVDQPQNQTQIPLKSSCFRGVAKVKSFREIKANKEIYDALYFGFPVIGGFKLSENFFNNEGYVFTKPGMRLGSGIHAQGHALLMIGLMELPRELHSTQGEKCVLVVNSWGEGWGKGGYACLSQKWFEAYRYDMPFLVLEEVAVK